jgi:hypothetical protein
MRDGDHDVEGSSHCCPGSTESRSWKLLATFGCIKWTKSRKKQISFSWVNIQEGFITCIYISAFQQMDWYISDSYSTIINISVSIIIAVRSFSALLLVCTFVSLLNCCCLDICYIFFIFVIGHSYSSWLHFTHGPEFSVTLLGNGFQRRTFLCFPSSLPRRLATISRQPLTAGFSWHFPQLLAPGPNSPTATSRQFPWTGSQL